MKAKEECGVTDNSLDNARMLIRKFGIPNRVILTYIPDPWEYVVKAEWKDATFTFTGFSWGYGGEGPHGLYEFLQMCKSKVMMADIANLDRDLKEHVVFERD